MRPTGSGCYHVIPLSQLEAKDEDGMRPRGTDRKSFQPHLNLFSR